MWAAVLHVNHVSVNSLQTNLPIIRNIYFGLAKRRVAPIIGTYKYFKDKSSCVYLPLMFTCLLYYSISIAR